MSGGAPRPGADPPPPAVAAAVATALAEDLLPLGDLTASLVDPSIVVSAVIASRSAGVLAGRACAEETFRRVDPAVVLDWACSDGDLLAPAQVVCALEGPLCSLLSAERTALNFLCHLSGVATLTHRFVEAVRGASASARVLDTRKTTPGLRALEKAAVRAGGGTNHRGSLSEAVLVKDNHLAGLGIADAVGAARRAWPGRMVEVECDREDQVVEAVEAHATVVLLDNMSPEQVARCVALVAARAQGSAAPLIEVSGGVTLATAPLYAAAGADLISAGMLTHSAPVLDLGLDVEAGGGAGPLDRPAGS